MPDTPDDTTLSQNALQLSLTSIGPYRLIQMLGVGGMGEVWRAEQTEPLHRVVALKLIKAGMDTKAVVARFDSERQALALMEHPNIAKVFDAGATPAGRPYFVMEYVHGLAITDYCDKHRLTIKERLGLFMQVCEGVASVCAAVIALAVALASIPADGTSWNRFLGPSRQLDPFINFGSAFVAVLPVFLGYYHLARLGTLPGVVVSASACFLTQVCGGLRVCIPSAGSFRGLARRYIRGPMSAA